ncbi:hypothetical protein MLD38_020861 [Melastoma candidum]|uniref:Uncharacterized protein n=1 Tax=Melastoma candidum TaxID=119954 RepID=A0ACB9QHM3_9MYRT|nr:hypothetical protein MLD38_020861 [Melastoma candidum]
MEQSKATTSSNVWIRHPRGSRKDFLDFDFPKKNTFTLSRGCVLPCYHKHNENDRHILGASDSPQLNTVTDLTLASAHNLVIIYDRQQALGLEIADLRKDIQNLEQVKLQQDLKQLKEQVSSLALSFAEVSAKLLRVAELVFSNTLQEHELHVAQMLEICRKHGLVLSPTKMKLAQPEVDFLGVTIGANKIRLQEHIIKRIADVSITKLQSSTKELRSWLGVLNYARAHIPKCGTLLGPLYNKTSPNADKRWSRQEEALVARIKALVTRLPDLQLPPKEAHIIIESDGSMEGWGAVCKWTMTPGVKDREEICAYASGIYPHVKSTIDSEIFAVMMALEKFKIYYLDKREVTIRTDCGAIISFHNKLAANKPSRVRWIAFCDYITGSGVDVKFEHIKGTSNQEKGGSTSKTSLKEL